jgi:uncharacterized protein (DUF1800 family)
MNHAAAQAAIRFGFGPGPDDPPVDNPRTALKAQLAGPDPGLAAGYFDGLPSGQDAVDTMRADAVIRRQLLTAPPAEQKAYRGLSNALYRQDAQSQLAWAAVTPAGFRERLVWFWANHFSVSASQNGVGPLIGPMIREAIRPHVNGKFVDMVQAVERHPAMLRYLDNENSLGPNSPAGLRQHRGLNENLGRECMELHTVGLAAGYTQADVTSMAKILTGWGIATSEQGSDATGFKYRDNTHEPGPQAVMGRSFDGGQQAGIDALNFLASYPTTYDLLARKLVTHFVADDPPPHAVAHIAGVLRDTKGDLHAASAALVDLPQAWAPGQKLKTPLDYMVSTLRAAPPPAGQPAPNTMGVLAGLGQPVWSAPLPNGWPDQAAAWAGSEAILSRVDFAYTYAGRFDGGAAGPQPADMAQAALGPLLRPATQDAMAQASSRREALTLFLASPEFQRR